MSLRSKIQSLMPKRFIWKLTIVHVIVIAVAIGISSWAIYSSACVLVEGIDTVDGERQGQFNQSLLQYFITISVVAMIAGSFIHHYVTKKMLDPIQQLIEATKKMQQGIFPTTVSYPQDNELGELIHQYNVMIQHIQKNEYEREKLLTDLSHEIRTPLASLTGYLQALKQGVIEGDEAVYDSLYKQAERLTFFMEQLDQLKEWGDNKEALPTQKKEVDLEELIQLHINMFALELEQKSTTITTDMEPCQLYTEESALQQVTSNVLDNAIRYGIEGEPITIKGRKEKDSYTLSVSGKSNHLTEEEERRVFERFYRIDDSRSRDTGGSGLGLAIAKEIMDTLQGSIYMESTANQTTCTLVFKCN
ncbi:MAG TPA: ATP-binding protein [Bacillota bacterium]|nr:ATP-binding protein [Bacillota bacterium]